jgi:hypothetical protein
MSIGKMTVSEVYPHLEKIAKLYDLRLNRVKDFRLARLLLAIKYNAQM